MKLWELPRQSVWWHAFRSHWKDLNVVKCKILDAWRPKWETRFYMGQRQEDYRTEISRRKKEGEILMWIVERTHHATCIMVTVASRGNAKGPFFVLLWKKEPTRFRIELLTPVMESDFWFSENNLSTSSNCQIISWITRNIRTLLR